MISCKRLRPLFLLAALALSAAPVAALEQLAPPSTISECIELLAPAVQWEVRATGPWIKVPAPLYGFRPLETLGVVTVGQYNVENLVSSRGRWIFNQETLQRDILDEANPKRLKSLEDQLKLKAVIDRADSDFMIWEEVEDVHAAQDFVDAHLGSRYRVLLIDGNDERGIDVAVLVKRDIPLDVEVQSHREILMKDSDEKEFSRDLVFTSFRVPGSAAKDPPLFTLVGTHYKSQRDRSGDPRSVVRRTGQVERTVELLKKFERENPNTPVFLMGDFNADIRSAPEFESLWRAGYRDSFDLSSTPVPESERITQTYHPRDGPTVQSQLDAIIANPAAQRDRLVRQAQVVPYLNADGTRRPYANSFREREEQGSDHWMVQMSFNLGETLRLWKSRIAH